MYLKSSNIDRATFWACMATARRGCPFIEIIFFDKFDKF
jgi:hypothetical protein